MKKKSILKKSSDFTEIINNSPYKKNNYYIIYYRQNTTYNHYGITVPTKIGKANIRNKIKRRIKNIIDLNENLMQYSYDYVIIIRKRLLELNYQDMKYNLLELMEKIGEKNE